MIRCIRNCVLLAALCTSFSAQSENYTLGTITIDHPYARATVPGQPTAGAYLAIRNAGKQADKLVSLSSPAADSVQIHTMKMEGDVMKMREIDALEIAPSSRVSMAPGDGYHLMLTGLHAPLKSGDHLPMTLQFEKVGKINISVEITSLGGSNTAGHTH